MGRANIAYEERVQNTDKPDELWLLTDLHHSLNTDPDKSALNHFDKFLLLATAPILKEITLTQIADVARNSQIGLKKFDEPVVKRGELIDSVILIFEGKLEVDSRSKSSKEILPGEFIGLANILSKKPYAQTIKVVSAQACFLNISGAEIIHLVDTDHHIASTLLRILAEAA